jgi:cytosine/adenosine deaminase-related metal-dependent hydrolase
MRGVLCYGLFNNPRPEEPIGVSVFETPQWMLEDARRVRKEYFFLDDGLVSMGLALTETEWFPSKLARREIEFAREIGSKRISIHAGMAALSRNTQYIDRLNRMGLMGPDLLFVHGSSLSARDLKCIAEAGAAVVSTPETELQMGMGFPVLARVMASGGRPSLGVDIVSNNSGDMFTQIRLNLQVQRAIENDYLDRKGMMPKNIRLKARDFLEVATIGGARAIGLDSVTGSLSPGKQADLIMIRADSVNMMPVNDPAAAVVMCANAGDVDTVMVGGKILKRDGVLTGVDWPAISQRLAASRDRIVESGRRKGFSLSERMAAEIFPITPKIARQTRFAGMLMRFPLLREPLLRMIMRQMKGRTDRLTER